MSARHDDLARQIRLFISEIGGHSIETPVRHDLVNRQGRPVKVGVPGQYDLHAVVRGKFIAIDAKTGSDRLRRGQCNYRDAVQKAGGIAFAAYSTDDVANRLKMEGLIDVD